ATNPIELETTVAAARRALRIFPRSHLVRMLLVQALQKRPGGAGEHEAVQVLAEGIALALTDEQRDELDAQLAGSRSAAPAGRRRVRELLDSALTRVQLALDDLAADRTPAGIEAAQDAVEQAVARVGYARELAGRASLADELADLDRALTRLATLEAQLGDGTE